MAKSKDLKQKLKAADRRRRQRLESAANQNRQVAFASPSKPKVDVVGMITIAILQHAEDATSGLQDVVASVALRSCLTGKSPSGEQSSLLWQSINAVAEQPGVSVYAFRKAVSQLLEVQKKHQDHENPSAFVAYLQLIAE
ncbi:MAG: hypothetical protein WBD20_03910 [Pirellulaceae bacterium]